jgi:hypothetical protein
MMNVSIFVIQKLLISGNNILLTVINEYNTVKHLKVSTMF